MTIMSARMAQVSLKRIIDAVAWSLGYLVHGTVTKVGLPYVADVLGDSVLHMHLHIYLYMLSLFMACSKKHENIYFCYAAICHYAL